jgi:hypothetical protein
MRVNFHLANAVGIALSLAAFSGVPAQAASEPTASPDFVVVRVSDKDGSKTVLPTNTAPDTDSAREAIAKAEFKPAAEAKANSASGAAVASEYNEPPQTAYRFWLGWGAPAVWTAAFFGAAVAPEVYYAPSQVYYYPPTYYTAPVYYASPAYIVSPPVYVPEPYYPWAGWRGNDGYHYLGYRRRW